MYLTPLADFAHYMSYERGINALFHFISCQLMATVAAQKKKLITFNNIIPKMFSTDDQGCALSAVSVPG